jgi:23S rRNA (cytosine1962-C5)-methyltransferase
MKKSQEPNPEKEKKAPSNLESRAPSHRSQKSQHTNKGSGENAARHDSKRNPASADDHKGQGGIGARVSRRAADRLRAGHVWVYASDIESLELRDPDAAGTAGEAVPVLLPVADYRGMLLGTALYSPSSQITLRLVSREAIGEDEWLKLLGKRLSHAIDRRVPMMNSEDVNSDSCRLCFSEADEIPGLVVDKYGDLAIVQLLTKGLDSAAVRERIVATLRERIHPAAILERPDPRIRELEGMTAPSLEPLYAAEPQHPMTATQFRLNGLMFYFDANSGQKTGAFLDQHANYNAAEEWAWILSPGGRALDVCTYQGGFALHLARVSKTVTGIDTSHASLEVAERNLDANHDKFKAGVDWVEGDAFEVLRDWASSREQFDTIVLDPPAFAKSKRAVEGAMRGYKELNLRAMQMLKPGGLLVTCSCSHHVSAADFEAVVVAAAADARRRVRLRQRRGAAPDHPVVLNIPETEYLKCLILEVE